MLAIRLLELGLVILIILFLLTQIIVPGLRNEPLFPLFRSKSSRQKANEAYQALNKRVDELENVRTQQSALEERITALETSKTKEEN